MTTHQRITSSLALTFALALGAGAAPAVARPFDVNANGSMVPAATATHTPSQPSAPTYSSASMQPTIVRVSPSSGGFDWGDAGIGAAAGFALSMLGLGSVLAVSQRRTHPHESTLSS